MSKSPFAPHCPDPLGQQARQNQITPEIGEAFVRLMMSDSRAHELLDSYPNGRLILSALYGRLGYRYPEHDKALADTLAALQPIPGDLRLQQIRSPIFSQMLDETAQYASPEPEPPEDSDVCPKCRGTGQWGGFLCPSCTI